MTHTRKPSTPRPTRAFSRLLQSLEVEATLAEAEAVHAAHYDDPEAERLLLQALFQAEDVHVRPRSYEEGRSFAEVVCALALLATAALVASAVWLEPLFHQAWEFAFSLQ